MNARLRQEQARRTRTFNWGLARWIGGRLVALGVLIGASWLLYDGATSPQFSVSQIRIVGADLASAEQVETAAAVGGLNAFILQPGEVSKRLEALPPIARADVQVILPDLVEVQIAERVPFGVWQDAGGSYLVDETGLVISDRPPRNPLPVVRDLSERSVQPGESVDKEALRTAAELTRILSEHEGREIRGFEYQPGIGIEAADVFGWRVRFGSSQDLGWKVQTLLAIRDQVQPEDSRISFVDVRFRERPYYR